MLTLLLVCSFSPKYRKNDRLRSTICCKQQCCAFVRQIAQSLAMSAALDFRKCKRLLLSSLAVSPKGFTPQAARHRRAEPPKKKKNPIKSGSYNYRLVEMRVGRSKQRLRNSEVSEFTRINATPARRGSRRRRHGIAAQSPRKEKEPDKIGFVFFSCGGDEGGRTPYLLNAIG